MARPIPISNQKSKDWNDFLVYFNQQATQELPQINGQPNWELLDKNDKFGNYTGGQDYYKKKYADFALQKGWKDAPEHLQESDFPVIQKLYTDIYTEGKKDSDYFNKILQPKLQAQGLDINTFDPSSTVTGKNNTEGWVGSVSRNFLLPLDVHSGKSSNGLPSGSRNMKTLVVPSSFNEGELNEKGETLYKPNTGGIGVQFHDNTTFENGGRISPEKAAIILHDGTIRGNAITDKQRRFFGAIKSGYIKEKGGYLECGGMIYEKGGVLPKSESLEATKKLIEDNKHLEFVKRIIDPNGMKPLSLGDGETATHLMASSDNLVYPTVIIKNGKLIQLSDDDAYNHAIKTKEYIEAPSNELANFIATNGYKQAAGWNKNTYQEGGRMKYEDGADIDFDDEDIEAVRGGDLEEISEENVEVKGPGHDKSGVGLNTGDEVRGGETMNTKKGMVFSASLINPETGNPFATDHKKIVKEIKLVEERGPRKKLPILKEREEELFEKQQKLNGNNGGGEMEDGGTVDPPTAADALKPKYFKVGEKEYTVRPNRLDAFLTEFPDAKEHDLVDGKLVLKTSQNGGQKKNISTETTQQSPIKLSTSIDLNKTKVFDQKADNPTGNPSPILDLDQQQSVDFFKERNLKLESKVKELQDGHYNDIIEFQINQNRDNLITDPFKLFKDKHGEEGDDIILNAARVARDNDNALVASYVIPEMKKREEGIHNYNMTMHPNGSNNRENIQNTENFKTNLDDIFDGYKGIKIKREDGTVLDTDQITPSQRDEIRKLVINTYQAKNTFDSNVKYIQESVQQAVTGDLDSPMASFIKEAEIDKGIIPASKEQWKPYFDNLEIVSEKYAPLIANVGKEIELDNAAYKQSYQNEVAEFTHTIEPKALEFKQGLETQVQNQELKPEEANALWDDFKTKINQQGSAIFQEWNDKINQNSQMKLKSLEDAMNQEIVNGMKGTILENIPPDKINEEYVNNSVNSFVKIVASETDRQLNDKSVWLKNQQQKIYNSKDYFEKFQVENIRGALGMAESVGGYISFLGGYEAGNIINDVTTQYNVDNPSYNAGHFEFSKLIDPDYWISVVGPMVGQQAVFLPLSLTGAGLGTQIAGKLGLGAVGTQIAQGIGSAIATRPLNAMVNSGNYYNELINSGMGTEEAGIKTADDFTYQMSLIGLDAVQMTFAFGKIGNPFQSASIKLIGGPATEGGEEVLEGYPESDPNQTIFQYATSDVGIDQFTGGAMGGMVMAGAFAAPDVASIFSKSEQKFTEGMLFDLMSQSGDMAKRYEDLRLTLDTLKERQQITDKQYQNALGQLEVVYTKGSEIPVNISDTQKKQILSSLGDINQLNQIKSNTTDETLLKVYDSQIKYLEKKVQETMDGTEPMYFIGKVPYSKEQFEQLVETPEVFDQIVNQTTTFNVINDETILNQLNEKIDGEKTKVSERGSQEEIGSSTGGIEEEKTITNDIRKGIETAKREVKEPITGEQEERIEKRTVVDYAKENGKWIDDIYSLGVPFPGGGNKNTLVYNEKEDVLYKSNNLFNSKNSVQKLLDGVEYHNEIFPESKYEVVGFAGLDKKGDKTPYVEVVLKQSFVPDAVELTKEEISDHMESIGFKKISDTEFTNGEYTVSDLFPRNVLKDESGHIYVIDDIITKNESNENNIDEKQIVDEGQIDTIKNINETDNKIEDRIIGENKIPLPNEEPPSNEPPIKVVENKEPPEGKESKFNKTIQNSTILPEEVKKDFEEKHSTYTPKTVKETAKNATEAWDNIKSRHENIEDAISEVEDLVNNLSWEVTLEQRGALAAVAAKELNTLREQEGLSIEQINKYDERAVELFGTIRKILTESGQTGSVLGKFMKEYYMSYPNGIIEFVQTSIDEYNDGTVGRPSPEVILSIKEMMDELLKSKEGKDALDEYAAKKENITKRYKERKQSVSNFYDRYINDIDNLKGMSFATPIPPGIIQSGLKALKFATLKGLDAAKAVELALAKIKEGMGDIPFDENKAKAWLLGIYEKGQKQADRDLSNDAILDPVKELQSKIDAEYQKRLDRFNKAKERVKESNEDEIKKAVDERWKAEKEKEEFEQAMTKLKGDKLRKFVYKIAFEKMNGKSIFTEQDIVRAYQQANGSQALTVRQQAIVAKNSAIIKDAWEADKNIDKITQNEWFDKQYKASQAATKIQEVISPRGWYDLISSAMAAGFLGPKTLLANVAANLLHKGYTAVWEDTIFSFTDILYSPGDKRTLQERAKALFNTKGTQEYLKAIPGSIKRAGKQMIEGTPNVSQIGEFSQGYQIRPLVAWQRMTDDLTKDASFLTKANDVAKDFYEGTAGIVHAGILRALSAGDTLFRNPEQAKFNQKFADELGVPLDIFLTDEKYAGYRDVSEKLAQRLTFQNKSPLAFLFGKVKPKMTQTQQNIAKWFGLTIVKPIAPYINTPINVKYEMLTTIPIFALPEFFYRNKNATDPKLSPEERFYNKKVAQKIMRKMVGSIPLWWAVSSLLISKAMEFVDADEEDKKDPKTRNNILYFQGSSIKLKINIPGMENVSMDAMKLGPWFDFAYIVDQTNKAYQENDGSLPKTLELFIGKNIKGTVEQTFFTGFNNLLKAIEGGDRDVRRILIDTYGVANANLLLPATFTYVTQMMDDDKVLRLYNDKDFNKELFNKTVVKRLGFLGIEGVRPEDLPPVYNVAGETIKTNETDQPDWIHYLFDFTRAEVSDPNKRPNVFLFKQWQKDHNNDWLFPIPPRTFNYDPAGEGKSNKIDVKLDPELKNEYQRILGKEATLQLKNLWDRMKGKEPNADQVSKAFEKAQKNTKRLFYEEFSAQLKKLVVKK